MAPVSRRKMSHSLIFVMTITLSILELSVATSMKLGPGLGNMQESGPGVMCLYNGGYEDNQQPNVLLEGTLEMAQVACNNYNRFRPRTLLTTFEAGTWWSSGLRKQGSSGSH